MRGYKTFYLISIFMLLQSCDFFFPGDRLEDLGGGGFQIFVENNYHEEINVIINDIIIFQDDSFSEVLDNKKTIAPGDSQAISGGILILLNESQKISALSFEIISDDFKYYIFSGPKEYAKKGAFMYNILWNLNEGDNYIKKCGTMTFDEKMKIIIDENGGIFIEFFN